MLEPRGTSIRRALACCALAAAATLAWALPGQAAGTFHDSVDLTGFVFDCADTSYTVTGGTLEFWLHEGSGGGNTNETFTGVPRNVTLTDGVTDTAYRLRGVDWDGEQANGRTGGEGEEFTHEFRIVSEDGGVADHVTMSGHISPNGKSFVVDKSTCEFEED